jgi:predicted MPP superfamily phosphohydrolase
MGDAPRHHDDVPHPSQRRRGNGFLRAKLRHAVLTRVADTLTLGVLGRRHHAQPIVVRTVEVRTAAWPREYDGLRIAHVTDFHLGHLMPVERAIDAVQRVAALRPDVLACTGDVVDLELDGAAALLRAMAAVDARWGHYLVLGNHDHLDDGRALAALAGRCGMQVLHGRVVETGHARSPLRVGGVDWGRTVGAQSAAVDALPEVPHLLLAHNPKAFRAAAARGVPLTLSGHTHGGQVALKGRPRANLSFAHRLSAGTYHQGSSALFVSVGAGAWFPVRVHCAPEVVLLTVRSG